MSTGDISRFVLRHKSLVVIVWIVVTLVAGATVSKSVGALSQDFTVPGREGVETSQQIKELYGNGGDSAPLILVVTLPEGTRADSPAATSEMEAIFANIRSIAPAVRTATYGSTGDAIFISDDGRTTFGFIFVPTGEGFSSAPEIELVREAVSGATVAGAPVKLTGYSELESGGESDESGVLIETLVGGLGALIVLAWVFGSFLAFVPVLMAAVSILTTFLVIWGVTAVADVNLIVQFLVALIGLGVAIDYSLLIVTRWREEREAGYENEVAVQRAMETAGTAVVFSGTTVAIGLLALVVLPVPFIRSIGYGGMLIPLVSVLVAITLLPVFLAKLGPRLDWPRTRKGSQESRAWATWTRHVVKYRWIATITALVILGILVAPVLSLNIGDPLAASLAKEGEARDGLDALVVSGIGAGVLLPYEILVEGTDPGSVATSMRDVDGVLGAIAPEGDAWRRSDTAVVAAFSEMDANSLEGGDVLDRVIDTAHSLPGSVRVGGLPAAGADFIDAVYGNFALMVGLIAIVTYVLLVRAFRSLLLPLKAIILNVISVGAAFGVMTFVWQEGHGAGLLGGGEGTGAIVFFVPLMVFAFLFGLSMDYEVFILARIREEWDATHDNDQAIIRGMASTGRLVTSAALILFLAFAALGSGPEVFLKTFATGLAAGILIDATVIRALLVPATVSLLGHWNWWLPTWLERFVPATAHGSTVNITGGTID